LPGNAKAIVCSSGRERRKHNEHRCDERVRSQPGHALPPLAFRSDEAPENQWLAPIESQIDAKAWFSTSGKLHLE